MRITGGVARGITLNVPRGDTVRPATDGMRQAVFSSIAARVPGACFLDLFAGSGGYGLEALSRGASEGYFVEKNAAAATCLRRNLAAVCKSIGREERGIGVAQADALVWQLPGSARVPDLVFIDPPWDRIEGLSARLFERLGVMLAAKEDPVIIFEMPGELNLAPEGWACVKRLGKGSRQPSVAFFRRSGLVAAAEDVDDS